ncbi:hypothetical protein AM1_B0178 (plasmid) [Acaryochloris marina MBIC11017]|uniref:Uncharacterized protein n=1 Tax=Acaryochloris marina (strain MBIC 11017) TaxID=329726 RepID=A8ZL73_ACAM1|nr:hypothetical protein AM1_B0178 [Acaryochloris marina MBIC11017]
MWSQSGNSLTQRQISQTVVWPKFKTLMIARNYNLLLNRAHTCNKKGDA